MMKIMDGNEAAAYASYGFTEVAGIYPITPASPMAELTDKWSSEGKLNYFGTPVKVVEMESEAGAAGMVHGSLQAGALTTTYTASQGLLLMIPNMYKIAGEQLPCVIHVAARSLATHALSIFGDHQDVYATRSTGFAILASSSVQQAMDLAGVAHLAAIKGKVPFLHFFDGFRTSHELQKVDVIDTEKLKELIDEKALEEFRSHAMNLNKPSIRGTAQNEDIYFQATEVRNKYYEKVSTIVANYMNEIGKITGRTYKPFQYYGSPNATKVIVAMGSVCETIKETVDYLVKKGENVGLMEVHLYRPFSTKYFLNELPKTVKKIAVLDRTKEPGSSGEPLYLDVVQTIKSVDARVNVVGGRYGLSSKNTTPAMIKGVFDFLDTRDVHTNFTVGIVDDVTNLSIPYDEKFMIPSENAEFLIYGYGSDGMVSASKDLMKITGTYTNAYVQGYFQYDSKKSGGVTVANLRFGKNPITSTYYVEKANLVVCTKDAYLHRMKMLDKIIEKGVFILNTNKTPDEVLAMMSNHDKKILQTRHVKMFIVDASKIAHEAGIPGKISTIMESIIFKLGHIVDFEFAVQKMKENLTAKFSNKGGGLVEKNIKAIDSSLECLIPVKVPYVDFDSDIAPKKRSFFEVIDSMEGDTLPVSSFLKLSNGEFEAGTSKLDKRDSSEEAPCYIPENCIHCNMCSLVCPHGVIRPFLLDEKEVLDAPESVTRHLSDEKIKDQDLKFTVGVSLPDCTGCSLCVENCPGKAGAKALVMKMKHELLEDKRDEECKYLFQEVKEKKQVMPTTTVKGSQFVSPKFEFPGACAGCGETPYLKLLTQLFGERMIVANATGCSSIYGASTPSMPYHIPWANSLFEDNAEFGFGMRIADQALKNQIKTLIQKDLNKVKKSELDIYKAYLENVTEETANNLLSVLEDTKIEGLLKLKDFIAPKSVWMIGGDGWAYDIGYNGIDHVLANKENVNILVLDTEVYSNTGGQASKSTRSGAVAKFAASGKETAKKNLAKMAMSYPHVYVGAISLGANPMQAIKVLKEAEAYNGPSIIIAYAPCIAQGIIKGMKNSIQEEKEATASGYFPIFHFNPENQEFKLDSTADFTKYEEFTQGEDRYRSLSKLNKEADKLLERNKEQAITTYSYYESLQNKEKE